MVIEGNGWHAVHSQCNGLHVVYCQNNEWHALYGQCNRYCNMRCTDSVMNGVLCINTERNGMLHVISLMGDIFCMTSVMKVLCALSGQCYEYPVEYSQCNRNCTICLVYWKICSLHGY